MGARAEADLRAGGVFGAVPAGALLPRAGRMSLGPVPPSYPLDRVAASHGWSGLPPFAYDTDRNVLHRTLLLPGAGPLTVSVRQRADGRLEASWGRVAAGCADRVAIRAQLRWVLALDDDLAPLWTACARVPGYGWVEAGGAGRLLRSPTVWEDCVRTLATTNASWARTRAVLTRLVDTLGAAGPAGERAFPSPRAVAAAGVDHHLRGTVKLGYRAPALAGLAAAVARGVVDPESWRDPARSDAEVHAEIRSLPGFGPYAADGLLGLVGRARGLALDSWVRARLGRLLGRDGSPGDAEIRARYAPFGPWAGTVLWLDVTRGRI